MAIRINQQNFKKIRGLFSAFANKFVILQTIKIIQDKEGRGHTLTEKNLESIIRYGDQFFPFFPSVKDQSVGFLSRENIKEIGNGEGGPWLVEINFLPNKPMFFEQIAKSDFKGDIVFYEDKYVYAFKDILIIDAKEKGAYQIIIAGWPK